MAGIQNSLNALITTLGAASMFGKNLKQREMSELTSLRTDIPDMEKEVEASKADVESAEIALEGAEKGLRPESIDPGSTKGAVIGTSYFDPAGVDKPTIESNIQKAKAGLLNAQHALEGKQAQLKLFEKRKEELSKKWRVK